MEGFLTTRLTHSVGSLSSAHDGDVYVRIRHHMTSAVAADA